MALDWIFKRTAPSAGQAVGNDGRKLGSTPTATSTGGRQPLRLDVGNGELKLDGELVVKRQHPDWREHQVFWRKMQDSFEGGDRYRNATYGMDRRGLPTRNLFRHKREYPDPQQFPEFYQGFAGALGAIDANAIATATGPYPGQLGADGAATALDDDYELRRARTPVPEWVSGAIGVHLGKIYDGEVKREGPDDLLAWWKDVDGRGTSIDDYMRETIAPQLLLNGVLDICIDYAKLPAGITLSTRRDEINAGMDKPVLSYLLPQNVTWWRTDAAGRYIELLVREYVDPADRMDYDQKGNAIDPNDPGGVGQAWRNDYVHWRLWRQGESIEFNYDGSEVVSTTPNTLPRVPIVRLIDQKKFRSQMIGKSRYERIMELQRAFYNLDSELILSNTLQAHPFLSGPEDYCKGDGTLSVGPGYLLPKKKNSDSGSYEGFEYVSPPKDPAESLRQDKNDLVDEKDRHACLSQPAGVATSGAVAQSGVSKTIDAHTGHKLLTDIAKSLARAERTIAEYALTVMRNRQVTPADRETFKVGYPMKFQLHDAAELIDGTTKLQLIFGACGHAPETEQSLIQQIIRGMLVGLDDDQYDELDDEINELVTEQATVKEQVREMRSASITSTVAATEGEGSEEQRAGDDPSGQSAGTMVSGVYPNSI